MTKNNKNKIALMKYKEDYKILLQNYISSEEQYQKISENLTASLNEKEILLKEIHHRVKNNLQVVSSLLNLQMNMTTNAEAKDVLRESATRIRTMSLIHEMLYQSTNLSSIDMQNYIKTLLRYLYEMYNVNSKLIKLVLKIDQISLKIDIAIPISLLINEIISNAFKYAFPDGKKGKLEIIFKQESDQLLLIIGDNGKAAPEINFDSTETLGMQLIHGLVKQLHGDLQVERNNGTKYIISIPEAGIL